MSSVPRSRSTFLPSAVPPRYSRKELTPVALNLSSANSEYDLGGKPDLALFQWSARCSKAAPRVGVGGGDDGVAATVSCRARPGSDNEDMAEKEAIRRWALTWREFGPELERIRLREVRDQDNLLSLRLLARAFNHATSTQPPG